MGKTNSHDIIYFHNFIFVSPEVATSCAIVIARPSANFDPATSFVSFAGVLSSQDQKNHPQLGGPFFSSNLSTRAQCVPTVVVTLL
jgi:hypothetical protein